MRGGPSVFNWAIAPIPRLVSLPSYYLLLSIVGWWTWAELSHYFGTYGFPVAYPSTNGVIEENV